MCHIHSTAECCEALGGVLRERERERKRERERERESKREREREREKESVCADAGDREDRIYRGTSRTK